MYNAGIILQGQNPSMFDGFQQGQQVGRQNALANLYKTQGAGIANGDQNALNALAQFDPQAAMSARASNFDFQQAQAAAKRQAEEHAAKLSAAEAAQAAEEIKRAVAGGMAAQTPEQWDAFVAPIAPDLVGQFGNRDMIAQSYMSVADVMEQRAKAGPLTEEGKRTADIRAGYIDANAAPQVDTKELDAFRKEFSGIPAVKAFSEQSQAFGRIVASAQNPSAAGDIALIFNYMKLLDPGSVVREGEFATAQNAGGVDDQVVNMYNRLLTGERLNDAQRQDFVSRADSIYTNAEQVYKGVEDQFKAIAKARNYPDGQAVIDYRYSGARETAAPGNLPQQGGTGPVQGYQLTPEDDALLQKYGGGN